MCLVFFLLFHESLMLGKCLVFLIKISVNFAVKRAIVSSGTNLPDEDSEERRLNQEVARWEEKLREIFGEAFIVWNGIKFHFFKAVG